MTLPTVQATGNLTADPYLRFTPAGKAVSSLRIACSDRKRQEDGSWVNGATTFLDANPWEAKAVLEPTVVTA